MAPVSQDIQAFVPWRHVKHTQEHTNTLLRQSIELDVCANYYVYYHVTLLPHFWELYEHYIDIIFTPPFPHSLFPCFPNAL